MLLHYLKSVSLGAKAQKICWGREAKAQKTTGRFEAGGAKPPELEIAETMLIVEISARAFEWCGEFLCRPKFSPSYA